jgi:hypothetical protein
VHLSCTLPKKEGREVREERRKEGRKKGRRDGGQEEGRKEGGKEGHFIAFRDSPALIRGRTNIFLT